MTKLQGEAVPGKPLAFNFYSSFGTRDELSVNFSEWNPKRLTEANTHRDLSALTIFCMFLAGGRTWLRNLLWSRTI